MRTAVWGAALCGAAALLADSAYRTAAVDEHGALHLVLDSGKEVTPGKLKGQVSFEQPAISPDGRTAGWLAMYQDPAGTYSAGPIAGRLVLYRDGRVRHTFASEQVFWDWQFRDGGARVAYSTGPTHGGAAECVLREVASGRILARWQVRAESAPPEWARQLRR